MDPSVPTPRPTLIRPLTRVVTRPRSDPGAPSKSLRDRQGHRVREHRNHNPCHHWRVDLDQPNPAAVAIFSQPGAMVGLILINGVQLDT